MGKKSREAVPVSLTPHQRRELERLWFRYGNYGAKTTKGNHSFIQGLLERGMDERPLRMKGYIPTEECERAVESILHSDEQQEKVVTIERMVVDEGADVEDNPQLRLVHSEKRPIAIDPELKELMDEIKRQQRARKASISDGQDAA